MDNVIGQITWTEKSETIDDLIGQGDSLLVSPMASGLEAEVLKVQTSESGYVLKTWNRSSKPDVSYQFHLLQILNRLGLPVSVPYGWGWDQHSNKVLLTSFDGNPITKVNAKELSALARSLSSIHQTPLDTCKDSFVRKHDFVSYFYPGIDNYPTLHKELLRLVDMSRMTQDHLIHGDFNLGNIVEHEGRYTVIDWTNGQLGDPRYDFVWSSVLMKIYVSERYGSIFLDSYRSEHPLPHEEIEIFEAIACLRLILLSRHTELPQQTKMMDRLKNMLRNNACLEEGILQADKEDAE
ncbi:aminoglycoside phosphotransferase family protein [Paenibacillus abyssi]|uniref:Aminoglycoside phosphotransferase domain-containing protein n=1 Tax=Paenibacillus abyssi TaxID=1340531 RepID=A0A917LDV4_9BACL|nr:aminoglycoside phosphotransferase family protein [Paenibacillus abyssi]GGG15194.1 hypothetical protein GCM10010916_35120 [Paenibacillus abyssi]